jgi:hypothetical protein
VVSGSVWSVPERASAREQWRLGGRVVAVLGERGAAPSQAALLLLPVLTSSGILGFSVLTAPRLKVRWCAGDLARSSFGHGEGLPQR